MKNSSFIVFLNFTTPKTPLVTNMMSNGRVVKMHESGKQQMIKFRVEKFGFIRIFFTLNRNLSTLDFPIIEVKSNGVDFGRHFQNGVSNSLQQVPYELKVGAIYDFFMITDGADIKFGIFKLGTYKTIGIFTYTELETLPYIGFASELKTIWIVEDGKRQIDCLGCN